MASRSYRWRFEHEVISRRRLLAIAGSSAAGLALAAACGGGTDSNGPKATPSATRSDLYLLSLEDAAKLVAAKQVSPVELTQAALARIEQLQPKLNAFITITGEQALAQARAAEAEIAGGNYRGTLHGIPIAHKDLFDTRDVRTTSGSEIYADRVPDRDATVVTRLADAGAISLGKLNMWEFAAAIAGVNEHWKTVRNPWNQDQLTGGTSAGSGAATAAGLVFAATGTDTGGSIRSPASFCGVVGIKPTYGRVSTLGMFPPSQTLDHAGPLARSVRDAAVVLQALAGFDPLDGTTSNRPVPNFLASIESGAKGLRVGVPRGYFWQDLDPDIDAAARKAITDLERAGAIVQETDFALAQPYYGAWRTVAAIETGKAHTATYPSRATEYGKDLGALLAVVYDGRADWDTALQEPLAVVARARGGEADAQLTDVDVIVMPTNRRPVLSVAEAQGVYDRADLGEMEPKARAENVAIFNLTGQPAISVPCGLTSAGMPVGLMFVARQWDEPMLLRAARAYELVRGPFRAPPI